MAELQELEKVGAKLASSIAETALAKRSLMDDIMETERQIMLADRKIQLEREMQACDLSKYAVGTRRTTFCKHA